MAIIIMLHYVTIRDVFSKMKGYSLLEKICIIIESKVFKAYTLNYLSPGENKAFHDYLDGESVEYKANLRI